MAMNPRDMEEMFANALIGAKVVELVRESGVLSRRGRKPGSTNGDSKPKSTPAKAPVDPEDNDD